MSRQSTTDLARRAAEELHKPISRTTVWEILNADAIKPWQYEHWIFPRAPDFFAKAAVVLDLYQGYWQDERLDPFDRVISSDEKTSIQARIRCHVTLPQPLAVVGASNTSTSAAERCNTWRLGTCNWGESWGAAKPRRASIHSGGWSRR